MVERGTERLCQRVRGIDDTRDVGKNNFLGSFPLLQGKMLDVNVTGTRCGTIRVNHQDCCGVILEQRGRTELRVSKLQENRSKVLDNLGGMNGGEEFGFGGASRYRGLYLGLVGQGTTAEHEDKAGDRASCDQIGGVCCIDIAGQFRRGLWLRELWQRRIGRERPKVTERKRREDRFFQ